MKKEKDLQDPVSKSVTKEHPLPPTLRNACDRIIDGIVVLDTDWRYTYVNQHAAQLLNKEKPEDLIGKNIWEEYPEGINQPFYKAYKKAVKTQEAVFLEEYYNSWDRYFENRIYPSPDGLTIFFTDITEQKRMEIALRDNLKKLREAQAIAHFGNWCVDLRDNSIQWSDEMYNIYGVTKEAFSHKLASFYDLIHPDDRLMMENWVNQTILGKQLPALLFRTIHPDGMEYWVKWDGRLKKDGQGKPIEIFGTALDITERKRIEQELENNRVFTESIINASPDLIYIYDIEKKVNVFANSSTHKYLGYSDEELKMMGPDLILHLMNPDDHKMYLKEILPKYYSLSDNEFVEYDFRMKRKDGEWRWFHARESIFNRNEDNTPKQIFGNMTDITERRQAEKEKQDLEERFRRALEHIPEVVVIYDRDKKIQFINEATRYLTGRSTSDYINRQEEELWPPEIYQAYLPMLDNVYKTREMQSVESEFIFPSGGWRYLQIVCVPILDDDGEVKEVIGITHDLTEHKLSERSLQESEERYRTMVDSSPYAIGIHQGGKLVFVNPAAIRLLGAQKADDLLGRSISTIVHPDGWSAAQDRIERMLQGEQGLYPTDDIYVRLDGSTVPVEVTAAPFTYQGKPAVQVIALDISEKRTAQEKLANESLQRRTLIENSRDGIVILDENGKVQEANLKFAEMLGYSQEELKDLHAWDWDTSLTREQILEMIWDTDETGNVFETVHTRKDGSTYDVEISASTSIIMGEKKSLTICRDISERKKTQAELEKSLTQLRRAIETTIQVLIQAIEIRDPYTAGHQKRVASLASAIAREIQCPPEKLEGVYLAASIHDIGKISVPSEILSKPSRLSPIEFVIVKEHAFNGYNILKDVVSPWPLAEIVYQHHERIDGSGYPRGLKGDEILQEARILTVADVVEAMASHRPYRPSLGIDAALQEIEQQRGILYDEQIVDACLTLFREKNFQFE